VRGQRQLEEGTAGGLLGQRDSLRERVQASSERVSEAQFESEMLRHKMVVNSQDILILQARISMVKARLLAQRGRLHNIASNYQHNEALLFNHEQALAHLEDAQEEEQAALRQKTAALVEKMQQAELDDIHHKDVEIKSMKVKLSAANAYYDATNKIGWKVLLAQKLFNAIQNQKLKRYFD
jgi:hypothetical protein